MRKFTIIFLLALATSLTSNAQAAFGVRAGANMSSLKYSFLGVGEKSKYLPSFHAGLVFDAPMSDKISFQPALLFSLKGGKSEDPEIENQKLNYIELPVDLLLNFNDKLAIGGGPYAAYLLSASGGEEGSEFLQKIDYGLNGTINYMLPGGLQLGLRYSYGMKNLFKLDDSLGLDGDNDDENDFEIDFGGLTNSIKMKNRTIGISLTKFF